MRLSVLLTCAFLLVAVFADDIQDEIEAAKEKYCGGISVSQPAKDQVFSNPTQVAITVERQPNTPAKIINGVDVYAIKDGRPTYLGTPWKGSYALETKATLTVDVTKTPNIELPAQLEVRVWVRNNEKGPDCTLMSPVFRVQSTEHTNAAAIAMQRLDYNVDRGCFGVDIVKPAIGEHVNPNGPIKVNVQNDPASQLQRFQSLDLYQLDLTTREVRHVQQSWIGREKSQQLFNVKYHLSDPTVGNNAGDKYTYFYRLTGVTQQEETCEFQSHPFYFVI